MGIKERIAKGLGTEVMTAGVDWNNAPAIKNYLELDFRSLASASRAELSRLAEEPDAF